MIINLPQTFEAGCFHIKFRFNSPESLPDRFQLFSWPCWLYPDKNYIRFCFCQTSSKNC